MEGRVNGNSIDGVSALLLEHIAVSQATVSMAVAVAEAAAYVTAALAAGSKLLLCGNGGSAADAQHIAAEFVGRFLRERRALPALALNANTSVLTALGNDYSFDYVFARQVAALGQAGDVLVAISTSGNSANVLCAAQTAKAQGLKVIGLTGASGGRLADICDLCLCVPSDHTPRIQEMHILIGHVICQLAEEAVC